MLMTVSGRRIEVPVRKVTFYLPGNGRTCDIHDQLISLTAGASPVYLTETWELSRV